MLHVVKKQDAETVLTKKAVLVCPTIAQWTARKYDKKVTNDLHKQKHMSDDAGRYNKYLVADKDLQEITQINGRARTYHLTSTLSWMDQEGQRLLPSVKYLDYMSEMRKFKREHEAAVPRFVKAYPGMIEEARKRLGPAFNEADYPHPNMIASKFKFEIVVIPVPAADFRCQLSAEDIADLESDMTKKMSTALEQTQRDALERAVKVLAPMVEKLKAYKPAKKKGDKTEGKFHDSLVENMREFVPLLRTFNFADDAHINELADKMEKDLCDLDATELREDAKARKVVAASAEQILADVEKYMA